MEVVRIQGLENETVITIRPTELSNQIGFILGLVSLALFYFWTCCVGHYSPPVVPELP